MEKEEILEGLLYIAGDSGIREDLLLNHVPLTLTELQQLVDSYDKPHLQIKKYGDKYFLQTTEALEPFHFDMVKVENKSRLSQASLEVLAIIAYNQPVSRAEIEALRGVNSDGPIDTLTNRNLVYKKEVKDERYFHYLTTDYFLEVFGLESLYDLPHRNEASEKDEINLFFKHLKDEA